MSSQVSANCIGNLVNLVSSISGPFSRTVNGTAVAFNPITDLEIWLNGTLISVESSGFSASTNTYMIYLSVFPDSGDLLQIIHHMPSPPFTSGSTTVYGFAIVSTI
jgi:hypothetical protein